jgi:predicted RNA-binding protein with PIN domain
MTGMMVMMRVLIDGYNLMHAMGLLNGPVGPHGLAKARAALFGRLTAVHTETDAVTVVLDARGALPGADESESRGPIEICYTLREEADDFIERRIAHDSAPTRLVVVSNDHRLRDAARRRGCDSWSCGDYADWLERQERDRARARPSEPDKPVSVSDNEKKRWEELFREVERES